MTTSPTAELQKLGVSIWLDDLSKDRLTTGSLQGLMDTHHVVGVTSNPTIFAGSVAGSDSYAKDIAELTKAGSSLEDAVFTIMVSDVQGACDVLGPEFIRSKGVDGRVSLEVSPELAHDTQGTIDQALKLWKQVGRKNLMIKIPATLAGLPAITAVVAEGISVNVTLIFSLERYAQVIDAYCAGIVLAQDRGFEISTIHSVASFFVSRVDSAIDPLLDAVGTPEAQSLKSLAAIANARLAYELFTTSHARPEIESMVRLGMNPQRPLWASTGVKDPALPQDYYVTELAVAQTVNTMPEKTLLATEKSGVIQKDNVTGSYDEARSVVERIQALGISLTDITAALEKEGVEKFIVSWKELLATVSTAMEQAA